MNKKLLSIMLFLFFLCAGAYPASARDWDPVLDRAYRFTFGDRDLLRKNMLKYENEFGISLHDYNNVLLGEVSKKGKSGVAVELGQSDIRPGLDDSMYYRAAVGQFLEYLLSDQRQYLSNASYLIDQLKDSYSARRDYDFWALFINAHKQLAGNKENEFISTVYSIWREVLTPLHEERKAGFSHKGIFSSDFDYHCVNLLNLIVNNAIVDKRMSGLYPLGPVVLDVTDMLPENEEYYRNLMKRFQGRGTDSANLNYTVALVFGEVKSASLADSLSSAAYEKLFREALDLFNLADKWADTDKGKAAVQVQKAVLLCSVWTAKLNSREAADSAYFGSSLTSVSEESITGFYSLYSELARKQGQREEVIHDNGFLPEADEYVSTMKELWNANSELVRLQSLYLEKSGRPDLVDWAESDHAAQVVFAHHYFGSEGYRDIIPVTAYFGASYNVAALAKTCIARAMSSPTEDNIRSAYNFLTYATMLDPFDLYSVVEFATNTNYMDWSSYFRQYFVPLGEMLSKNIRMCADDDRYASDRDELIYLSESIYDLFIRLPQILDFVPTGGTRKDAVKTTIVIANLFSALHEQFPVERIRTEMFALKENGGLKDSEAVLRMFGASDMVGIVNQTATQNRRLAPYDYYGMYDKLGNMSDSELHTFLERLYYTNRASLDERANFKIRSVADYVLNACSALSKHKLAMQ
ncbi:hypothetical protein [Maridesulfovibrio sp.]|uniref:hypothetical protein n=1 Tax=Maridesulfovibrio sp. TaxID=2795000 RepID=UPI002A1899D2|nr:hypothetical protein [Maridesulfovibrio sp.]